MRIKTLVLTTLSLFLGINSYAQWVLFEDFENFTDIVSGEMNDKWLFQASDVGTTPDSNAKAVPDPDPDGAAAGNTVMVMDPGTPFEANHRSRLINRQDAGLPSIDYGTSGTAFFRWYTATVNIDGTEFPPEIDMNVGMSAVDVPTQYNESGPVTGYDIGEAEWRAYDGDPQPDDPGAVIGFQNITPNSRPNNVWVSQWFYVRNYSTANQQQDYQVYYREGDTGTPILAYPFVPGEFAGFRAKPDGDIDPANAHLDVFYFTNTSGNIAGPQALDDAYYADDIYIDQNGINLSDPLGGGGVPAPAAKLTNISTRGVVGTNDDVIIGGFVIGGDVPQEVLIQATGPELAPIVGILMDPVLTVTNIATGEETVNDNWEDTQGQLITDLWGGAPPLVSGSLSAALVMTLDAGSYTAKISGKDASTGIAIIEVFEVD